MRGKRLYGTGQRAQPLGARRAEGGGLREGQ
jgi:hypothetical protein